MPREPLEGCSPNISCSTSIAPAIPRSQGRSRRGILQYLGFFPLGAFWSLLDRSWALLAISYSGTSKRCPSTSCSSLDSHDPAQAIHATTQSLNLRCIARLQLLGMQSSFLSFAVGVVMGDPGVSWWFAGVSWGAYRVLFWDVPCLGNPRRRFPPSILFYVYSTPRPLQTILSTT